MQRFIKIGHRGACGYEPENTLISFARAIELKVDMVEFDVMKCKSGHLVVIHDDTLNRTTNGRGKVKDFDLYELEKLNAGNGQKIPTLHEVLDFIDMRCKVNIEIKDTGIAKQVALIIKEYILKGWSHNDFLVSSFEFNEIKEFKIFSHEISTELLFFVFADYIKLSKEFNCNFIGLEKALVNGQIIEDAHKNNIKILVYTVNDKSEIEFLKKLGVDGIFSNYPDRL